MIYNKIDIEGTTYSDAKSINIEKTANEFNGTSHFTINFDNVAGRHKDDFSVGNEITIYADETNPPTTKIFVGLIEDLTYAGSGQTERLTISGRDYGSILQDIKVEPTIFKNREVSIIIEQIFAKNIDNAITLNNLNVTSTTLTKITFSNISVFDALKQLAELSGFYFYVDEDKDLHFEEKDSISSGLTFDNSNVTSGKFRISDSDMINKVTIYGDRQLTGAKEIFTTGTDNTGSVYVLDAKPHNTLVTESGTSNTTLQPGGIIHIDDPATQSVKYLVDFDEREIILTSGTIAGDNILPNGSVLIIDYQRSTPVIKIKQDNDSISIYGEKHKYIVDPNIKDIEEANEKATQIVIDQKDPITHGNLEIKGVLSVTPGNSATVNLPNNNQNNETYSIIQANYDFNTQNNLSERVLDINVNRKLYNFLDIIKEQILKLRALESSQIDTSVTNLETSTGSIGISGTGILIQKDIGSEFRFNTDHSKFNDTASLLAPNITGSTVIEIN